MNLIEASVRASLDRHVALHIGGQALYLPWHDIRARAIGHYHGERIVVGLRPEALTPVPLDSSDNVLRGSIRYVEHHGHESLAYLDIGATAIQVDDLGGTVSTVPASAPRRRVGEMLRQLTGRAAPLGARLRHTGPAGPVGYGGNRGGAPSAQPAAPPSVFGEPERRHRRPAEFVVRLAPYPSGAAGQAMAVAVHLDQAHFFDERGDRIDIGWR